MKKLLIAALSCAFLTGCGNEAASVGIIGGADGPTAVFVTAKEAAGLNPLWIIFGAVFAAIAAVGIVYWVIQRRK